MRYLFLIGIMWSLACSGGEEEKYCINFDRRQCLGDPWSESVDINAEADAQEDQLKEYLESKGITVYNIKVDLNYHDAVCEACFVCPDGARFFISINEDDESRILDMDPLNYSQIDCDVL